MTMALVPAMVPTAIHSHGGFCAMHRTIKPCRPYDVAGLHSNRIQKKCPIHVRGSPMLRAQSEDGMGPTPWSITKYYTKKKERRTDALGNIIQSPETIAEPMGWGEDAKMQLAVQVVARELGRSELEVQERLNMLYHLVPDFKSRVSSMKAADMVRLAANLDAVASKLLRLRDALPEADISRVVSSCPRLLLLEPQQLEDSLGQVQEILGDGRGGWQQLIEDMPSLLEPQVLQGVLSEMRRLFGADRDVVDLLIRNPSLGYSCQSLQGQARGDRDPEYLSSLFGPVGSAEQ